MAYYNSTTVTTENMTIKYIIKANKYLNAYGFEMKYSSSGCCIN